MREAWRTMPPVERAMDVGEWLRGLGFGEYEEKFRDNKIDADRTVAIDAE